MADVITANPELIATKQDKISEIVQRELAAAVTLLPTISDMSALALPGFKQIRFPKLSSFVVTNRASGAAGDASALTSATDNMDLDQNAFVSWIIDNFDEIQANIPAQIEFAKRAAAAQGRFVDGRIITELEVVGIATTTSGDITRDIVLEMRERLLLNEAKLADIVLAIDPTQEAIMLAIAEFTEAQLYGTSNIPDGVIGSVYGVPVIMNTQLGTQQYFMYEKQGIAIGFQRRAKMESESKIKFGTGARLFVIDQLFGVKGLQLGESKEAVPVATESALVVKDNN